MGISTTISIKKISLIYYKIYKMPISFLTNEKAEISMNRQSNKNCAG